MLAKLQGAGYKRKRGEDGDDVDMEDAEDGSGDAEGWMDVDGDGDGEETTPAKRTKTNSGAVAVTNKREPRSNRQLAGMRDGGVSSCSLGSIDMMVPHLDLNTPIFFSV